MIYQISFCLISMFLSIQSLAALSSERKIEAHLLLGDSEGALRAVEQLDPGMELFLRYKWKLKALALAGEESQMLALWKQMYILDREQAIDREILEELCWAVLRAGQKATGLQTQLISLVGAAFAQEIRAVDFLLEGMRHSNGWIRSVAVELAVRYGDAPLRQEIERLFEKEPLLEVRLSVIRALGQLRMYRYLPQLMDSLANSHLSTEEVGATIESIVLMQQELSAEEGRTIHHQWVVKEVERLSSSRYAALRRLACALLVHCKLPESELKQLRPHLLALIQDPQASVAAVALKAWGLLRQAMSPEIAELSLKALDPEVAITAAWVWLLHEPKEAEARFLYWLHHPQAEIRALAGAALAHAGPYGTSLAKKRLRESELYDPYVALPLALALIGQREETEKMCGILEEALQRCSDKWMFSEQIFKVVRKTTHRHNPAIANFPEVVNQKVRLELLNLLAMLESPGALDSIKHFLKESRWGLTGLAAAMLLEEGDGAALDLVRQLLQDPHPEIRLEAALVLATVGKEHAATRPLLELYPELERFRQLQILEALGQIGDKQVLGFLLDRLQEPSQLIRLVAASAILQTLNH